MAQAVVLAASMFAREAQATVLRVVVVAIEYPSMIVLAPEEAKALADPEYSAWLKGLGKLRKIVSDSTYDELQRSARRHAAEARPDAPFGSGVTRPEAEFLAQARGIHATRFAEE